MEKSSKVADSILEKKKELISSQNQGATEKEISIEEIAFNAKLKCNLYFLSTNELLFHTDAITLEKSCNLDTFYKEIKKLLVEEEIERYNRACELYFSFSTIFSQYQDNYNERRKLKMLFTPGYGSDCFAIKRLKLFAEKLANITDNDFKSILIEMGFEKNHKAFLNYKSALVSALNQFFDKANQRLVSLQKILPNLTMDDLDHYRIELKRSMNGDVQRQQRELQRYVMELMRMYALYPRYQKELLKIIIDESRPKPSFVGGEAKIIKGLTFFVPIYEGKTQQIDLRLLAENLCYEGLYPSYIKDALLTIAQDKSPSTMVSEHDIELPEQQKREIDAENEMGRSDEKVDPKIISFNKTLELFLNTLQIPQEFQGCSTHPRYENELDKTIAIEKAENILKKATTVSEYNVAFNLMAPFVNRHKNARWDSFFGNENTRAWNKMMHTIRTRALETLFKTVNRIDAEFVDAKIHELRDACEMPLFNQHRNNHWYTGAFGETHAVSLIKKEIANLEGQKKRSTLSLK